MSHRYSRHEKEKWVPSASSEPKRPPVLIPPSNNDNLIAANRLTIMGRVTNPTLQRPRAVVDFLPQVWNLEGRVTGRELGPEKFQLKFESEADLLSILNKGPYHYKKWMILLQRWEPTVSESFPSKISFWLRVHDMPLHYWNDQALDAIGGEIGLVTGKIADDARVKVEMNGLWPLIMQLEIQLPSGDLTDVELEYIKIEKHCFTCFSLFHEEVDCPRRPRNPIPLKERKLGITQRIALQRIEADKKRHDDRRGYSRHQPEPRTDRFAPARGRDHRSHYQPYGDTQRSLRRSTNDALHDDNNRDSYRQRPSEQFSEHNRNEQYDNRRELSSGKIISSSETPRYLPTRRVSFGDNTSKNGNAPHSHTPPSRSLHDRLEFPLEQSSERTISDSRGRRSAFHRLSEIEQRNSPIPSETPDMRIDPPGSATPRNLAAKEAQINTKHNTGSSSGNRGPVLSRLQDPADQVDIVTISLPPTSRGTGNRKVTKATSRRVTATPRNALKIRRTTVTKSSNTPRKKLRSNKASSLPCDKAGASRIPRSNSTRSRQSKRTEGQDFHPPPRPLP